MLVGLLGLNVLVDSSRGGVRDCWLSFAWVRSLLAVCRRAWLVIGVRFVGEFLGGWGGGPHIVCPLSRGGGGLGLVLVGLDRWPLVHCRCCCSGLSGDCGGGMVSIFSSFTHGLLVFCSGMCVSCRCVITVVGVCLFLEGTMISRGIAFAWPLLARGKKRAWWWSRFKEPRRVCFSLARIASSSSSASVAPQVPLPFHLKPRCRHLPDPYPRWATPQKRASQYLSTHVLVSGARPLSNPHKGHWYSTYLDSPLRAFNIPCNLVHTTLDWF